MSCDEAGQLISTSGPAGTNSYTYDTNGNRRSLVSSGSAWTLAYAPGTNRLLTSPSAAGFGYDADGNPSTDGNWNFSYDSYDHLVGATQGSGDGALKALRTFNGRGMRVRSTRCRCFGPAGQSAGTAADR